MNSTPDPHNDIAEEALIGSILIAAQYYRECAAIVAPGDFYDHGWGHVWLAFDELDKAGKPIDIIVVVDQLDKTHGTDTVTASQLMGAENNVPYARNAVAYAETVAECAGRRRLLAHASECARLAHDTGTPFLDGLEKARKSVEGIPVAVKAQITSVTQLDDLTNEIEDRMKDPKEVWGITTGFSDMDKRTGGWQKGEFTVWCGSPGIGKSMSMGQFAYRAAESGAKVKYYSLEMRYKQLWRRLLSYVSGVDSRKMRSGFVKDWEWPKIMEAAEKLSTMPISIVDGSDMSLSQIRADIYRSRNENGVDIAFIDYFAKVSYPEKDPLIKDNLMSAEMKTIADKEDVALIVAHSMPKTGIDSKVPDVQNASGSIFIIHNADNAVYMTKHIPEAGEQANPKIRTLLFAKMRDLAGPPFMNIVQLADRPGFGQIDQVVKYDPGTPNWMDND